MFGAPQILLLAVAAGLIWAGTAEAPKPRSKPLEIPVARSSRTGLDDWPDIRTAVAPRIKRELALAGFEPDAEVFIRIYKQSHELQVFLKDGESFRHYRTYPICTFSGGLGPKLKEGDMQAPEGFYTVTRGQMNPESKFHLSFNLGYPNAFDQSHGRTGSALMVHGNCVSIGCYAMTDAGIEEVYFLVDAALAAGQKAISVHALPFRMDQPMLDSEWTTFWEDLKQGHDAFEATKRPPKISVRDGRYVVQKS
jgi:murein L,D-transpeptidase YafK